jgi:outer membrane protein TolC
MVQVGAQATPNGTPAAFQDEYVMWSINPAVFGNIEQMSASENGAYISYIDTVRKALREVSDDLSALQISTNYQALISQALAVAGEKAKLNQELYQQGVIAYVGTVPAQLNYHFTL